MLTEPLIGALQAAAVGEVVWLRPDGRPDAAAVTPLVLDGRPALAFPYAYAQLGRVIGTARQVAVVLSDPRLSGSAWKPIAVVGRPRLIEDTDSTVFTEHLLDQELRKHPPSRTLADSPILRREHWWFLPRVVVTVDPDAVLDVGARAGGVQDGVVGVSVTGPGAEADRLWVGAVGVVRDSPDRLSLTAIGSRPALSADEGRRPAVLLCHDFSTPDVERWTSWTSQGSLSTVGSLVLDVEEQVGDAELPPPLRLMARIRRQRDLARACRRALPRR